MGWRVCVPAARASDSQATYNRRADRKAGANDQGRFVAGAGVGKHVKNQRDHGRTNRLPCQAGSSHHAAGPPLLSFGAAERISRALGA